MGLLKSDLRISAGLLKEAAPDNHLLAYITPNERDMLVQAGGSGHITKSGIPSFEESWDMSVDYGSDDSSHDFSNDIGDVGNQGYTPPTPDESGLGDIGNINPYRGSSQIDNTDRINTALENANAASQLKNFTTSGNVIDLFKPNLPILGMSYLYDQWKNRNNKEC